MLTLRPEITHFDAAYFISLRDISVASTWHLEDKVLLLGNTILQYDLHDVVQISRLHKHFDVVGRERIVMQIADQTIHIDVENESGELIPYMWGFSGSQWKPLQFTRSPAMMNSYNSLVNSVAFLHAFSAKLMELGASEQLGLCLVNPNTLQYDASVNTLLESTSVSKRKQRFDVVPLGNLSGDAIATHWRFHKQNDYINHVCTGHCHRVTWCNRETDDKGRVYHSTESSHDRY